MSPSSTPTQRFDRLEQFIAIKRGAQQSADPLVGPQNRCPHRQSDRTLERIGFDVLDCCERCGLVLTRIPVTVVSRGSTGETQ